MASSAYGLELGIDLSSIGLYAREDELEELHQAYVRSCSSKNSPSQIVWLSGYAGTGKTALVQHVFQSTTHNYCCSRFDSIRNALPFAELVRMVEELCVVVKNNNHPPILIKLDEANILVSLVPELHELIQVGQGKNVEAVSPRLEWAYEKLKQAFRSLIKATCRVMSTPLVILFDNLQWAGTESLGIFECLLEDEEMNNILFIASYRENEVETTSPLAKCIQAVSRKKKQHDVTNVRVANLTKESLDKLLADLLQMPVSKVSTLSELIYSKTQGNAFYSLRLLKHIHAKEFLYFSPVTFSWEWRTAQIRLEIDLSDNVVEFMTLKVLQLPPLTAGALKVASCMGMVIEVELLKSVLNVIWGDCKLLTDVEENLQVAVDEQLINMNADMTRFKFAHDKIQAAAYDTIVSDHVRQKLHLRIGQYLQDTVTDPDNSDSDWKFILAVDQLNRGEGMIKEAEARVQLAKSNLRAAKKVVATSAFELAASFLEQGQALLGNGRWIDHYWLTLEMANTLASAHASNGSMALCLAVVEEIYITAQCREDKFFAQSLHVEVLSYANRLTQCIEVCLRVLQDLGHDKFPKKPGLIHIVPAMIGVQRALKGKTDTDILATPICTDKTTLATMDILCTLACAFYFAGQDKFIPLITCRMISLSLKYGINRWTPYAFAGYGIAMTASPDFAAATRFGNLSLTMMKVLKVNDPKALTLVRGLLDHLHKPLSNGINTTLQVYDVAFSRGDLMYMGQSAVMHCLCRYVAGVRLQLLAKDVISFAAQLKKYNQVLMWKHLVVIHWSTLNLMGLTDELVESTGVVLSGDQLESWLAAAASRDMMLFHFWTTAMASHFHCGNYVLALSLAEKSWASLEPEVALPFMTQHFGISALIAIDQWRKTRKSRYWKLFRRFRKRLKMWAKNGNLNGLHFIIMLDAEEAIVAKNDNSNNDNIRRLYDASIAAACRSGFIHDAALASARCGKFFKKHNDMYWATHFLARAKELYLEWGASMAVNHLNIRFSVLLREESSRRRSTKSTASESQSGIGTSIKGRSRKAEIERAAMRLNTPILHLEGVQSLRDTKSPTI